MNSQPDISPKQLLEALANPYALLSKWVMRAGGWAKLYKDFNYTSDRSFRESFHRRARENKWNGKDLVRHLSILVSLDDF